MRNFAEINYRRTQMTAVNHTTLNPRGPGCVRIHLVPPKFTLKRHPSAAILNGRDVIPLNSSWAILLNEFINQVNVYAGHPIGDEDYKHVVAETIKRVSSIYPDADLQTIRNDLLLLTDSLWKIALGEQPDIKIGQMSIGEYAPYMRAPHRMDLMISAMTKNGRWNCNQKCLHCYAAGQKMAETRELSTAQWRKVLDKCREAGIPQVTFTGGEPTMRRDLVDLVQYAEWFVTRLNTNGVLMTPELCGRLYEASLDSVQITFYSDSDTAHNTLVGMKQFEKTVAGIKNALAAGLNVSINTPLCTINRDYVKTLEFLHDLGIQYVTCSALILTGNARSFNSETTRLQSNELFQILESAANFCIKHEMELAFTSPGWLPETDLRLLGLTVPTCGACLSNMAIAPDGTVVPCQSWLDENAPLGNFLTTPWPKIWNSPACKKIRWQSSLCNGICPLKDRK